MMLRVLILLFVECVGQNHMFPWQQLCLLLGEGGSRDANTLSLVYFGCRETLEKEINQRGVFLPLLILPLQSCSASWKVHRNIPTSQAKLKGITIPQRILHTLECSRNKEQRYTSLNFYKRIWNPLYKGRMAEYLLPNPWNGDKQVTSKEALWNSSATAGRDRL